MAEWYDDSCFDDMTEVIAGKEFRGDDWRRVMKLKEAAQIEVVSVVGITFRKEALKSAMESRSFSPTLVPEPTNMHDKEAIRVEINDKHLGYIPRGKQVPPESRIHICKWSMDPPHVWLAVEC